MDSANKDDKQYLREPDRYAYKDFEGFSPFLHKLFQSSQLTSSLLIGNDDDVCRISEHYCWQVDLLLHDTRSAKIPESANIAVTRYQSVSEILAWLHYFDNFRPGFVFIDDSEDIYVRKRLLLTISDRSIPFILLKNFDPVFKTALSGYYFRSFRFNGIPWSLYYRDLVQDL